MSDQKKHIVMLGCFDTKGEEYRFLYDRLCELGNSVTIVNLGVYGSCDSLRVDYETADVAAYKDFNLEQLRNLKDRAAILEALAEGAVPLIEKIAEKEPVDGLIGMAGGSGSYMLCKIMTEVSLKCRKICMSTMTEKDFSFDFKAHNIQLIPSIVDILGLNSICRSRIRHIAALINDIEDDIENFDSSPDVFTLALTAFGNTTACVERCHELLAAENYDVLTFHANGTGGKAMEELIRKGLIDAVIDVTTTELADELCSGVLSAGPGRLTAAGEKGLIQIIVPGCVDMVNYGSLDSIPDQYKERHLYSWSPAVTLMRTSVEENTVLGCQIAQRANDSKLPPVVILPLAGVSQLGSKGGIYEDQEADSALFNAIRNNVNDKVEVIESPLQINDAGFAELLIKTFKRLKK